MPEQHPLQTGWDLTEPRPAVAAFLGTLPARPQLLALGEPTHLLDAFPAWRNRLFRILVEDHGFRSIALESDIIAGQRVNAHVTSGQGTPGRHSVTLPRVLGGNSTARRPHHGFSLRSAQKGSATFLSTALEEVMQTGFSHGFGAVKANRELVEWMRDFNAGRNPADHLRFYGFDAPLENLWAASPRASLLALHAFLTAHLGKLPVDTATLEQLCGEDTRWTNPAAGMDAAESIGNSGEARQLRWLADDLCTLLRTETPGLAAQPEFWEARLHARTATGLLLYHAVLADPAPNRVARMLALRDLLMADHLSDLAEREQERGPTLVFAHNAHLQRNISTMRMGETRLEWWSAGAHVSLRLGQQYAFIASDLGAAPAKGIEEPGPDTLQGVLMNLAGPVSLVASRELTTALPQDLTRRTDVPPRAGYFPLAAQDLPLTDGVLFVKNAAN
ncbi:hypothetical protein Dcar01_02315 [Deinococcus carri]|uniref:Erythromycin esterase n=1 Tax=Deinococcus carri TaxID=1211323 RepID=A0ABP9W8D1_9DEIO